MALKKQWYDILAPKMFGEMIVGETMAVEPKQLIGRKITVSLMDISNNYSKFYMKLNLQIENVDGQRAFTKFVGHECMYERIYRMVQRHARRVDVIQDVKTKDGIELRVKTLFIIIRRVNSSLKGAARKCVKELLDQAAKTHNLDSFVQMILKGELQSMIKKECSKIYPVGNFEIRKSEIKKARQKIANK